MACEICKPYVGYQNIDFKSVREDFEITDTAGIELAFGGKAVCKHCGQHAGFDYEEFINTKLRLWFETEDGKEVTAE